MTGLLNFHRLAAVRGDGLHPKLVELLERRAALAGGDPKLAEIGATRDGAFVQAGPGPQPKMPAFLPGNVASFKPRAATQAARRKTSSA